MANILVTVTKFDERCKDALSYMREKGHNVIVSDLKLRELTPEEILPVVKDVDAAIIGMDTWDGKMFDMATNVKAVAKFGVGVDNIDLDEARERQIYAINAAGANAAAVAEVATALMIGCMRNVVGLNNDLKEGKWTRFIGEEICGKTVGIIGFGQIGRRVARIMNALGARVIVYKRTPQPELALEYNVEFMSKEDVIAGCDILTLHIPGAKDCIHMINEKSLKTMKRGAYIVNTGRGCLLDENAVLAALEDGQLTAVGLDVFEKEPIDKDSPLLNHPRVVSLPHTGGETLEAYAKIGLSTAKSVCKVLEGEEPDNWVNRW